MYLGLQEQSAHKQLTAECLRNICAAPGRRLDEHLSIIGLLPKDLDHKGKCCLNFIAHIAGVLGSRGAGEEEILLLWTDLVIQDMEHAEKQVSCTCRIQTEKPVVF